MTSQEQDMINGLIDRVQKTQLQEKDADAEVLLQQGLGRNPDSLYILAQTVLVQQYALDQAQQQLAALKAQAEQLQAQQQHPKPATSFLGGLFGGASSDRSPAPPPPPTQSSSAGQYAPVPGYAPQGSVGQASYPTSPSFGAPQFGAQQGGGFLRGAMQTAAGVAAGALAFEGVESLLHGFGNSMSGMGGGGRPEEIVNNYYGDDSRDRDDRGSNFADDAGSRDNNDPGSNAFTDGSDQDNFAETNDDSDDDAFEDAGDSDDSSFDDGGDNGSSDDSF